MWKYFPILVVVFFRILIVDTLYTNFADINCGRMGSTISSRRTSKIVGGNDAQKGEFPWIVSLTRRGGHFCGGTIINSRFILTAGHCLCTGIGANIFRPTAFKITMGQYDLSQQNSEETYESTVKSIMIHPNYICNKPHNDIALVELEKNVYWSKNIAPACLPSATGQEQFRNINFFKRDFNHNKKSLATVAGWGWTNEDASKGGRAKRLQKADVNIIENGKCQQWYRIEGKKTVIFDSQMCAGWEEGGVDACWADSGGPLMVHMQNEESFNEKMIVVGVVSTGIGCARPRLPGLYTRISNYIQWIERMIQSLK